MEKVNLDTVIIHRIIQKTNKLDHHYHLLVPHISINRTRLTQNKLDQTSDKLPKKHLNQLKDVIAHMEPLQRHNRR